MSVSLHPTYTDAERTADAVIHWIGVVSAPVGAVLLFAFTIAWNGGAAAVASSVIYGIGLVAMLSLSAAYNMVKAPRLKERLRPFDHAAIYVMIAGTYTPFATAAIGGWLGYGLLALVWLIAVAGILLKVAFPRRFERSSIFLYLALGWIGLPAIGALIAALPVAALILLLLGGVFYTAGVGFHVWDRLPFQNAVWHGLVLVAAGCHYAAVLLVLVG